MLLTHFTSTGLSVADTVFKCFPKEEFSRVLVVCGPGFPLINSFKEITGEMV
jgi:hypothetical protein